MPHKKPPNPPKDLAPLIPMEDLKKVVSALAHVPKSAIKKAEERAKAPDYPEGLTPRPKPKARPKKRRD
jgi:hypothetical protein